MSVTHPPDFPSGGQPALLVRQLFLQRLVALSVKPAARDYYIQWTEAWTKIRGYRSADATTTFLHALGRSEQLQDWQFRQAVDAVYIFAHEILALPWTDTYDWQGHADQAWSLEADHRAPDRESTQAHSAPPAPPADPPSTLPETEAEVARITDAMRRAIRIAGLAYPTEKAYVHWNIRYTRFCLAELKRTPRDAGPAGMTAYLNHLALELNVGPATQKQALNAMAFLTRKVFGVADFTIKTPNHGHTQRHPPVVLSRREVAAILAHLEDPWKLVAQLMYGGGLRLMECLRLRVKDFDLDQFTITIHDDQGGRHRAVPLPVALVEHLQAHLAKAREKHLRDLAGGAGEVHMPEGLLRKWPKASQEWEWQYVFAAASSCPHPRTGRVARHHLNEFSMQRQFKNAVNKANIARHVTSHCLRNSFATHLLQSGTDIRTVQTLLGHASVETTMIYLPILKRPGTAAMSPMDMP